MPDDNWYEKWPKLMEYIREKSGDRVRFYNTPPYCDEGWFQENFDYVIVSETGDREICITGWRGRDGLREGVQPDDSGWMVDSIWHNDKKLRWRIDVVLEGEE